MKYIISENQSKRIGDAVLKLYNDGRSVEFISKITGYDERKIYLLIIDEPISEDIECGDLTEMVYELYSNKLLKTNFVKDDLILNVIGFDQMNGALSFVIDDTKHKDFVSGLATPYWDGDCVLPIDYESYAVKRGHKYDELDITGELFTSFNLGKPNTLRELIEWGNNEYPSILFKKFTTDINTFRDWIIN